MRKIHGKFTEVKKFGMAKSQAEAVLLCQKANDWIRTADDTQHEPDFDNLRGLEVEETERVLSNIDALLIYREENRVACVYLLHCP